MYRETKWRRCCLYGALVLFCARAFCQDVGRPMDLGRLQALYSDLQSADDHRRDLATLAVLRDPDVLAYPETKERLVELLERLNALMKRNYISGKGMPDEWTSVIISPLGVAIPKLYHDDLPERAFLALASTAYNPDSKFAKWLGEHSRPYLAQVIELARPCDPNNTDDVKYGLPRQRAVALLAHLWNAGESLSPPLTARERSMIHGRIVSALSDPGFFPRLEAIETLGRIGDTSVTAVLEGVATKDDIADKGDAQYLRTEARKALEKIHQRVASKP